MGRRLARTLAPPTSAVDLETLNSLETWRNQAEIPMLSVGMKGLHVTVLGAGKREGGDFLEKDALTA